MEVPIYLERSKVRRQYRNTAIKGYVHMSYKEYKTKRPVAIWSIRMCAV
jgi:hypothetical protein